MGTLSLLPLLLLVCLSFCSFGASGAQKPVGNESSVSNMQGNDTDTTDMQVIPDNQPRYVASTQMDNEQASSKEEANLEPIPVFDDLIHRLKDAHELLLGDLDQLSSGRYHGRNWLAAIEQLQQLARYMAAAKVKELVSTSAMPTPSSSGNATVLSANSSTSAQPISGTSDTHIIPPAAAQHSNSQLNQLSNGNYLSVTGGVVVNENLDGHVEQPVTDSTSNVTDWSPHAAGIPLQGSSIMYDSSLSQGKGDVHNHSSSTGSNNHDHYNITRTGTTQPVTLHGLPAAVLSAHSERWRKTGVHVGAQAAFTLTALKASNLLQLEPPQADEDTAYVSLEHGKHRQAGLLGNEDGRMSDMVTELQEQVMAGSTEAALSLADRHFTGFGITRSCWTGVKYANIAANGLLVEHNEEGASSKRAQANRVPELRTLHIHGRDFAGHLHVQDAAIAMDADLASRGSSTAQRRMAYRQLTGTGLAANTAQALEYFEAQAAAGDAYAMSNLAIMLWRGVGVKRDVARAHTLLQQAAEAGYAPAWNGLGVLHWSGDLGHVNVTLAMSMLQKGADADQPDALYNLGLLKKHAPYLRHDEAVEHFERADELGHWKAPLTLANLYETGVGVEQNCATAEKYFRKFFGKRTTWDTALKAALAAYSSGDYWSAFLQYILLAEQGCSSAAANAGWMLLQRQGYTGPGYLDLASRLLERAARQNHSSAAVDLGHMLLQASPMNLRFQSNASIALLWFNVAAEAKDAEGLFLAGWAHHTGQGTEHERNATAAIELYQQSIASAGTKQGHAVAAWTALLLLRVDMWLESMGSSPLPVTNLALKLQKLILRYPWQESEAEGLDGGNMQLMPTSEQLDRPTEPSTTILTYLHAVGSHLVLDTENACLIMLVVILVLVLWIRNRKRRRDVRVSATPQESRQDEPLQRTILVRQPSNVARQQTVTSIHGNQDALATHSLPLTYRRSVSMPPSSPVRGPSDHGGPQHASNTPTALNNALDCAHASDTPTALVTALE